MFLGVVEVGGGPGTEGCVFDEEVGVDLLEDEEEVGDGDGAFEEPAAGFDRGGWVFEDEAGEGGFELAAGVCNTLSVGCAVLNGKHSVADLDVRAVRRS